MQAEFSPPSPGDRSNPAGSPGWSILGVWAAAAYSTSALPWGTNPGLSSTYLGFVKPRLSTRYGMGHSTSYSRRRREQSRAEQGMHLEKEKTLS
ncbi:hypothetical protein F4780DRAFT_653134 [Xylariomycetidae sp. FL0641]|nr:hypothetical protein F4780DRAFT_653134 [Xylariomycetidae sp. FL0641]